MMKDTQYQVSYGVAQQGEIGSRSVTEVMLSKEESQALFDHVNQHPKEYLWAQLVRSEVLSNWVRKEPEREVIEGGSERENE